MRELVQSPDAKLDLLEIWTHIANNDLEAADSYIDGLVQKSHLWAKHECPGIAEPAIAKLIGEEAERVRSFLYRNHRCIFLLRDPQMRVLAYLHTRRHRDNALRERLKRFLLSSSSS